MEHVQTKLLKIMLLVVLSCSVAFGWYADVTTDRDLYPGGSVMRIGLFICNEGTVPVRIKPFIPALTEDVIIPQTADANQNVIPNFVGTARLTKLNPGPAEPERAILLPLFGNGIIVARSRGLLSNCYVRLVQPDVPEPNNIDPNAIVDDEVAPKAPEFFAVPGDYLLSCTITDSAGLKVMTQKVVRIVRPQPTDAQKCLRVDIENNKLIKEVNRKADSIDLTGKQTLKNTNMHTLILNRILQLVSRK